MPFSRISYQQVASFAVDNGDTVDLIAAIGADERFVLGKLTVTVTSDDMGYLYIFKIPDGGAESVATAIVYGFPLWPQQLYEMEKIVLNAGEGLAVGVLPAPMSGGQPVFVFNAHGDLQTGIV